MGELSARSDQFRVRWTAHNVRIHTTGVKLIHHPAVGDIELPFESFLLAADPSQCLLTYTAEPGSPSQDALSLQERQICQAFCESAPIGSSSSTGMS
jgi:hypothetical protein